MTGEPDQVIEEYLALVKEHLPESISEDVITELRTYMLETARDLGAGEVTLQSAKKVVAQFGAPSEVAEEYKYSMLPDSIPDESESPSDERQIQQVVQEIEEEKKDPEVRKDPTASSIEIILQGAAIIVVWSFLVVLGSTLVGPIWLFLDTIVSLFIQVILVLCGLIFSVYYQTGRKKIFWKRDYPEWSLAQKILTLPENTFPKPNDLLLGIDILGTLAGIVIFLFSTVYSPSPYYIPVIVVPVTIALLAKSFYSGKRMGSQDPVKNIRAEIASTFAALVIIDGSRAWIYNYMTTAFSIRIFIESYSIIWGAVLLLQLVARGGDLWWDTDSSDEVLTVNERENLVERTKDKAGATILRVVGWIVLFSVFPTYCLMIAENVSTPFFAPFWIAFFLGPVYLSPIVLYYFYRRWRLKVGAVSSIVGERSRIEALGDLILSLFLLGGFTLSTLIWTNPIFVLELVYSVSLDIGPDGALYFLIGFVSSELLLLLGLGFRVVGNCLEFKNSGRKTATELIAISGRILIVTISLRVGIDVLSYNHILFPLIIYPFTLLLIVMLAFQVETSGLKLRKSEETSKPVSEKSESTESTISKSIRNTNPSKQFPGN